MTITSILLLKYEFAVRLNLRFGKLITYLQPHCHDPVFNFIF